MQHGPDRLHHRDAIGGLDAGTLERVVEGGVLIGREIQMGCVRHHADADVPREAIGKQPVEEAGGASEHTPAHGKAALETNQPPEVGPQRLTGEARLNGVEDLLRDRQHCERDHGANGAAGDYHRNDVRPRVPGEPQKRRDVADRPHTFVPAAPVVWSKQVHP